jgi:aryl-alcohol dehydrogenase-like predicted oxidoreductase
VGNRVIETASRIERRILGRTNLAVSVLGFGAAEIGYEDTAPAIVDRLLGTALDAGLNVIDTAECYKGSEEKIGRTLAGRRKACLIFTKCGHAAGLGSGPLTRALNKFAAPLAQRAGIGFRDWERRTLEKNIERSLRLLRTDYIDVLQLHSCPEQVLRRGDVIEVLQRARDAGKTRFIGYSGDGSAALHAVRSDAFDTLQTSLNIADQQAIDLNLPEAAKRRMGIIAKRPIANAIWKNIARPENSYHHAYWDRLSTLRYDFLQDSDSFATALRFTMSIPGVHTAIVGTAKAQRWVQNAEAVAAGPLERAEFESTRARWNLLAGPDWLEQP